MKVLFLDIDGVLNCRSSFNRQGTREIIEEDMVERINRVIEATGCSVVVSSTWRILMPLEELKRVLGGHGFLSEAIIDATPHLTRRDDEIATWLESNLGVSKFAVVDDSIDDLTGVSDQLVRTSFETGVLDEHTEQLIQMLI